jgi:hypothetical protein
VGYYKETRPDGTIYESNSDIPAVYQRWYRYVSINKNKVKLTQAKPPPDSEHIFQAGPVLIEHDIVLFTESTVNGTLFDSGTRYTPFQCRLPDNGTFVADILLPPATVDRLDNKCRQTQVTATSYTPNCQMIKPGEFSHAGNPNPRTAIGLRHNRDGLGDLVFVYVEGRNLHGDGMDLVQLAKYMYTKLAVYSAVNLDGGRSSCMAWKTPETPDTVIVANGLQTESYPVGNIITVTK